MKLFLPLKDIQVTQGFGLNYVDFYQQWGLKGHNGVDFRAKDGCPVLSAHDGVVTFAGIDQDGGISITLQKDVAGTGYKTIYYHLKNVIVQQGQRIRSQEIIGYADNTGKYTTGNHLHFGLKFLYKGLVQDYDNGYRGAVDPSPYFALTNGDKWYEPAAYHRYGREQSWLAEFKMRFKNIWLHRTLNKTGQINKIYDTKFINKLVYGGWDFDAAINPAMNEITDNMKKVEYERGDIPFKR